MAHLKKDRQRGRERDWETIDREEENEIERQEERETHKGYMSDR